VRDADLIARCCCGTAQVAAFLPAKGKFVPDEEEELARPKGALQDPSISLANPKKVRGRHMTSYQPCPQGPELRARIVHCPETPCRVLHIGSLRGQRTMSSCYQS